MNAIKLTLVAAAASLVALSAPSITAAASPYKTKIDFASVSGVNLATGPTVDVTLAKAKKKWVLEVTGMVVTTSTGTVMLDPSVNGLGMQGGAVQQKCNGGCTVTGHWYLDLTAADLANPGVLFGGATGTTGLPLLISLEASAGVASNAQISVTAELKPYR